MLLVKKGESSHPLTLGCEKWVSNTVIRFERQIDQRVIHKLSRYFLVFKRLRNTESNDVHHFMLINPIICLQLWVLVINPPTNLISMLIQSLKLSEMKSRPRD